MPAIAISGFSSSDNPGPGPGLARALKHPDALTPHIFGLCYDAMETGLLAGPWTDRAFLMPYPSAGLAALARRLDDIHAAHGLDMVIPCLDVELPLYVKLAAPLAQKGIVTFLPNRDQFMLRSKDRLAELASNMNLSTPTTEVVTDLAGLYTALERLPPPVMIKGAFYRALRADSLPEAIQHFHSIAAEWGLPILVQRIIQGEEVNLVGVGDGQGGLLGAVSIKKMQVTSLGKMWTGISIHHPDLDRAARCFVEKYGWRGPFELECMTCNDGLMLIEINPRFPAWVWFCAALGVNLPDRMVRHALGLPSPSSLPPYPAGKVFARFVGETMMGLDHFQKLMLAGEH